MSIENPNSDYRHEGFENEADYVSALKALYAAKLPTRPDFHGYDGDYRVVYSGNPEFNLIDGHEMDSEWFYPEVSRRQFRGRR